MEITEWNYSKCWLQGKRERCTTGTFRASLTKAEFLKVAGGKTALKAVISGIGSVTMRGWVLEHIRAAADMVK
jgi:hypothetical protein